MNREVIIGGTYRHFKGFNAHVLALAKHTETGEELVVYACKATIECRDTEHDERVYARPIDMFLSEVDREKYPNARQKYRFELLQPADADGALDCCPYCGCPVEIKSAHPDDDFYMFVCTNPDCDSATSFGDKTKEECIRAWNTRNVQK